MAEPVSNRLIQMSRRELPSEAFGILLKRYRTTRGWTQDELAEAAGISVYSISNLERSAPHRPRRDTLELLASALALTPDERADFIASGLGRRTARSVSPSGSPIAQAAAVERRTPNLPFPPTPLLGREREMAQALASLARPAVRLLTLVGPGGSGKTHLALDMAWNMAEHYPDGAYFVSLAPLRDPAMVSTAVAHAIGLKERGNESPLQSLTQYLSSKHVLLVLDNFEHLGAAAPQITSWLETGPYLQVLVTSRVALHLRGEYELAVPPLDLPEPGALPPVEQLAQVPAVELFLERVRAVVPSFELTESNAGTLAAICCRLDGLPLSLELAAPLLKLLSPDLLLRRLTHRLDVLNDGPVDAPERQQSLRATLAWSYDLLSPPAQQLFGRLAVFASGASLEAIEAICADDTISADQVLGVLATLRTSSLLESHETEAGSTRVTQLETIREFGWAGLVAQGEAEAMRRRHAGYFLGLAEEADAHTHQPDQLTWLRRLEEEHHNLRAALQWALDRGEVTLGLQLSKSLWPFWHNHNHLSEGRRWLEQVLAQAAQYTDQQRDLPAALYTAVLNGAGWIAFAQGDFAQAATWYEQSLAESERAEDHNGMARAAHSWGLLAQEQGDLVRAQELYQQSLWHRRAIGDTVAEALPLNGLGIVARLQGDLVQARAHYEASLAIWRAQGDQRNIATLLNNIANVAVDEGEWEQAASLFEESLSIARRLEDSKGTAVALNNLAYVEQMRGQYAQAVALAEEAVALWRQRGDNAGLAGSLLVLSTIALAQENIARTADLARQSLRLCRDVGAKVRIAECLERLAFVAWKLGSPELAAERLGSATALRETLGVPIEPRDRAFTEAMSHQVCSQLRTSRFVAACGAGRELPLAQAIAEALA